MDINIKPINDEIVYYNYIKYRSKHPGTNITLKEYLAKQHKLKDYKGN